MKTSDRTYYISWGVVFIAIGVAILVGMYFGFSSAILSFLLILSALLVVLGIHKREALPLIVGVILITIVIPFLTASLGFNIAYGVVISFFVGGLIIIFLLGGAMFGGHKEES